MSTAAGMVAALVGRWGGWRGQEPDPIALAEAQRIYEVELERVLKEDLPKMVEQVAGYWPRMRLAKEWSEFDEPMIHHPTGLKPVGFKVILFPPAQA